MDFVPLPHGRALPPSPSTEGEEDDFLGKDFPGIMHSLGGVGLLKKLYAAEQLKHATPEEERETFQADVKKRELPELQTRNHHSPDLKPASYVCNFSVCCSA